MRSPYKVMMQIASDRGWSRPYSSKRDDPEDGRARTRTNATIPKMVAPVLEQTRRSRRWSRPYSNKRDDPEDGRARTRHRAFSSKMIAFIFEIVPFARVPCRRPHETSSARKIECASALAI